MINKVECVMISCDRCKQHYESSSTGFSIFQDVQVVHDYASDDDWYLGEDIHYCPDCHSWNDDDELIVKPL